MYMGGRERERGRGEGGEREGEKGREHTFCERTHTHTHITVQVKKATVGQSLNLTLFDSGSLIASHCVGQAGWPVGFWTSPVSAALCP